MDRELWDGVEFKLSQAAFFLEQMGKTLVPPRAGHGWHPAYGPPVARWQPDFYYHLDAFIVAARSVPDVIQKCFGWDKKSKDEWPRPLDREEIDRRKQFQADFSALFGEFVQLPLSRVRVGTVHWLGVPSVQTRASTHCGEEFTGRPNVPVPSVVTRKSPPGTGSEFGGLFGTPVPVDPSWPEFTLVIPRDDGTTEHSPLFPACRSYLESAQQLVTASKKLCERVHRGGPLTSPLAVKPCRP